MMESTSDVERSSLTCLTRWSSGVLALLVQCTSNAARKRLPAVPPAARAAGMFWLPVAELSR